MKFMQSSVLNMLGSLGGLVAFVLAFGWLALPTEQIQLVDLNAVEHLNSVLESVSLFGLSPWLLLTLLSFALGAIYSIIFNLNLSELLLAVIVTAMTLLVVNTLNLLGTVIALFLLAGLVLLTLKIIKAID